MPVVERDPLRHHAGELMDAAPLMPRPMTAGSPRSAAGFRMDIPQHPHRARMIHAVMRHLFSRDAEFRLYRPADTSSHPDQMADFVFAVEDEPHRADVIFNQVRWGGQFVYLSHDPAMVESVPADFIATGFEPLHGPGFVRTGPFCFIPYMGRKLYYFVARKLALTRPREITERFTYSVNLVRGTPTIGASDSYVVMKEVPTIDRVIDRLRTKFTDVPTSVIEKRALKFTTKVFPLFLTREAAMLKILHRDLPREYRCRVPSLLHVEQDEKGYAKRIWMNWLRIGGRPLSQLEFARQSTDLLRVVHENAQIIHLDLRLDNFVITENGVCFVDFGSAVRMSENIGGNPLLSTIFDELMRTSQIQRMLYKMSSEGTVTSKVMSDAVGKVDKQVDLFYLAVQINQPLMNPDFASLVNYDPKSPEAEALAELTRDILKPADPANPRYKSAAEMLAGINRVEVKLKKGE